MSDLIAILFFFFKQKTAYEMRISDWSSDVCSSDLIGTKISALDRALQLNAAAFHYIYYDKQVRGLIVDPIFNQLEQLVNIPKARINGAEIEVIGRPVSGLTLRGAVTYVDSKVLRFVGINTERVLADYSG